MVVTPQWLKSICNRQIPSISSLPMTGLVGNAASSSFVRPKQVNTLLYCLGEEVESVLISTNITEEERKDYSKVIKKFNSFFKVRRNVIFEQAQFNCHSQMPGESVEQYIIELYNLVVEHCNYGDLKSEMIWDRLVVGIQDLALSERLQLDTELTLEKAKMLVRQR